MTKAICVEHVSKRFRLYGEKNQYLKATLLQGRRSKFEEFWAVDDVSFEVPFGSTFGIIGSNGSGKSTLLKCLAGILAPDKGRISVNGRMSALLELGAGFHPELSGRENIFLNGAILGMSKAEISHRLDDIVDFAGLGPFIDSPVKNYSSGMVVRLGFAIAINVDPEILLIDEVLAVGDEEFQLRCHEKIEDFRRNGSTIVLVSHGLTQITQLCDTTAWMDKSCLRAIGPSLEIVSEYTGASHNAQTRENHETGQRWGTMEAEILSIQLLDGNGTDNNVTTNHPMTIRVNINAHRSIDDLVVGLRITDLHGANVWGSNTKRSGHDIRNVHGMTQIEFSVPRLPLLSGVYDLTAALSDLTEVHEFDHWDRRVRFTVQQNSIYDEGIVTIDGKWKHES